MPGSPGFDSGHATRRSVDRVKLATLPDRVPDGPTSGPPRAIESAGSRDERVEGGVRALAGGQRRYDGRDRSLRRSRRSLRGRAVTLAMAGTRLCTAVTSRHRRWRLHRRSAWYRGFPRDPPALVGGYRSLVVVEVSLRCPAYEASMPARHAMRAAREATKFGDREDPCRSPKRSGPLRPIGRPDPPGIEEWCSLSRPVTCQAWRDDLPCVEDDPSSIGRSTFDAWRTDVPRDDQRPSSSGRST